VVGPALAAGHAALYIACEESIAMDAPPRRAEGVTLQEIADGFMAHDPAHGRVHYLNPTAAIVLELCDGATSAAAIAAELGALYALPAPPLEQVAECLVALRQEQLVS
jgi:hypothetical protein